MAGRKRTILVVLVAAASILAAPMGGIGLVAGTNVTSGGGAGGDVAYPGQTVRVMNMTVASDDSVISSDNEGPQFGVPGMQFSKPGEHTAEMFINSANSRNTFDESDIILRISKIYDPNVDNIKRGKLLDFQNNVDYSDYNRDGKYSKNEPIIRDNDHDMALETGDNVIKGGASSLSGFQDTYQIETYIENYNSNNGHLDVGEPILNVPVAGQLSTGPLDTGTTKLLRGGSAPIKGFDAPTGDYKFIDSLSDGVSSEYDDAESIIIDNGNNVFDAGSLDSGGDYVKKPGFANLNTIQTDEYYFINSNDSKSYQYDQNEPIIQDSGISKTQIDGNDKIIFSGKGMATDFESGIAYFGTGDIHIGNSDDAVFDMSEFIYIESGEDPGYDVGQDFVLTTKGAIPDRDTDAVSKITGPKFTNVVYLDLDNDGRYDATSEKTDSPGGEPIIEFPVPKQRFDNDRISTNVIILKAFASTPSILDGGGNWLEGTLFRDLSDAVGPYQNGQLEFSDSQNGHVGVLDTGEAIIENGGEIGTLEKQDFVIGSSPHFHAIPVPDHLEYIDANRDEQFTINDYIIDSFQAGDSLLEDRDKVVSIGGSKIGKTIDPKFEFIDSNRNGNYDRPETVIKSQVEGDDVLNSADEIWMVDPNPGLIVRNDFERSNFPATAEMYIDTGVRDSKYDEFDVIVRVKEIYSGTDIASLDHTILGEIPSAVFYIDSNHDGLFNQGEYIFVENDSDSLNNIFGDRVQTVTVHNDGSLAPEYVQAVTLRQNGTPISTAASPVDGRWILRPNGGGTVGTEGPSTNFSITATIAPDAPPGESVEFAVGPLSDGGRAGAYDPGDAGLFLADGDPVGGLEAETRYTVEDPAGIEVEAEAYPGPEANGSTVIELAFTDRVDPGSTDPSDFAVETVDVPGDGKDDGVTPTRLADDDGDRRVLAVLNDSVHPSTVESVRLERGAVSVGDGIGVPAQTVAVSTASVTLTEASADPTIVFAGERVALLANEGENVDERVRIDAAVEGDGAPTDLVRIGTTGEGSQTEVVDTGVRNASRYRVGFESEDGTPGETITFPVRNLSLTVAAVTNETTDVAGPIEATIRSAGGIRSMSATLRNASDGAVLATKRVRTNASGDRTIGFPPRVGNVTVGVTDLGTGTRNRTGRIHVRKGYPGATFRRSTVVEERGDVVRIPLRLVDTTNATVTVGTAAVGYRVRIPVADDDGDGLVNVTLNTHRVGTGPAGRGIGLGAFGDAPDSGEPAGLGPVTRLVPRGRGLDGPLEAARYELNASVDGEVTDFGVLNLVGRSTSGAETLVAPADAELDSAAAIANWTTPRETVAIGDQAVVAINASGLTGFLNESRDFRRGSPAAERTGAYVEIVDRSPPPNARARHLNVSRAETVLAGAHDTLYFVLPTTESPFHVRVGDEFGATFVLNETSPYVPGSSTPDVVERESANTNMTFAAPSGRFREATENGTLDLPASASASITGETNVAPGTNVTVVVESDDENATFRTEDIDTVAADGTFSGDVDLAEYPEGTEYTLVARANGEDLTRVLTGEITEGPVAGNASLNRTRAAGGGWGSGGGGGGGGSVGSAGDAMTTTTEIRSTPAGTTASPIRDRVRELVPEPVLRFVATQATVVVVGLGTVAVFVSLWGLRRLLR